MPSYGGSYGSRDQTNPPYLPPTYPTQYLQGDDGRPGHMGGNYDASMAAYSYNRSIPGFSAAAVASGVPPLPIYQGWNQDAMPLPPYTAPSNHSQYSGYGGVPQTSAQYYQPVGQQNYHQNTATAKSLEQDLSEGEFEDVGASVNTPPVGYGSSQYRGNDGTGYMDTAQRAVHSRAQDYSPQSGYQSMLRRISVTFPLFIDAFQQTTITLVIVTLRMGANLQTPTHRMCPLAELTSTTNQRAFNNAIHLHPTTIMTL